MMLDADMGSSIVPAFALSMFPTFISSATASNMLNVTVNPSSGGGILPAK